MDFPSYPKMPPRQFASLPNNIITRLWFWYLSRYMNAKRYKLTKRGRKAKRPELRGYCGNMRLKDARRIGLYIDDKHDRSLRDYWLERGRVEGRYSERRESERRELKIRIAHEKEIADRKAINKRKAIAAVFIERHLQN